MTNNIGHRLLHTEGSPVATLSRLALGVMIFAHGAQKALGWFGGYGYEGTMAAMTRQMGLPALVVFGVIAIEFVGGLALIVGAGGRLAAAGVAAVMIGAIATVHAPYGFFMDWFGTQGGHGYEFHLLAIALAANVAILGSGALSVDRWLDRQLEKSLVPSDRAVAA